MGYIMTKNSISKNLKQYSKRSPYWEYGVSDFMLEFEIYELADDDETKKLISRIEEKRKHFHLSKLTAPDVKPSQVRAIELYLEIESKENGRDNNTTIEIISVSNENYAINRMKEYESLKNKE